MAVVVFDFEDDLYIRVDGVLFLPGEIVACGKTEFEYSRIVCPREKIGIRPFDPVSVQRSSPSAGGLSEQFDGDVWRPHACADVKNVSAQPVFGILRPGGKTRRRRRR